MKQAIREVIQNEIKEEIDTINKYLIVFDTLEQFEGKKITKRIITALEKANSDFSFYFDNNPCFCSIVIREKSQPYDSRTSFLLMYNSEGNDVNIESFKKANAGYYEHAVKRNAERQALLDNDAELTRLANILLAYMDAMQSFEGIDCVSRYAIRRLVERD